MTRLLSRVSVNQICLLCLLRIMHVREVPEIYITGLHGLLAKLSYCQQTVFDDDFKKFFDPLLRAVTYSNSLRSNSLLTRAPSSEAKV
jgi:hypothetical protein